MKTTIETHRGFEIKYNNLTNLFSPYLDQQSSFAEWQSIEKAKAYIDKLIDGGLKHENKLKPVKIYSFYKGYRPITKALFCQAVGNNWESKVDEFGHFESGMYEAFLLKEIMP